MLRYRATGVKQAANSLRDMARRAERLDDAAPQVHDALLGTVQPIAEDSGRLAASFQQGHPEHVFRMSAGAIRFGSSVPYASFYFANSGTVPFDDADAADAGAEALADYIVEGS